MSKFNRRSFLKSFGALSVIGLAPVSWVPGRSVVKTKLSRPVFLYTPANWWEATEARLVVYEVDLDHPYWLQAIKKP
jgi:hypothetical protein